jgi:hypothetical protein
MIGPLDNMSVPSDGRDVSRRGTNANAIFVVPELGLPRSSGTSIEPHRIAGAAFDGAPLQGAHVIAFD